MLDHLAMSDKRTKRNYTNENNTVIISVRKAGNICQDLFERVFQNVDCL